AELSERRPASPSAVAIRQVCSKASDATVNRPTQQPTEKYLTGAGRQADDRVQYRIHRSETTRRARKMIDGNTEAQRLLAEVKFARSEGTMTTLRQLQTEIFKFMRSAKNTKNVSLDDLRVLRSFLRDPFAPARRAAPHQKNAISASTQERAPKAARQSSRASQQRTESQASGQRRSEQLGDVAESTPSKGKILYYKHPASFN